MSRPDKTVVYWPDGRTDDWYTWVWFPGRWRGAVEHTLAELGLTEHEAQRLIDTYNLPLRIKRTNPEVKHGK